MAKTPRTPSVTVVIPTLNGADTLPEVLAAIAVQQVDAPVEVLVIDSSSTDSTESIARSFPFVRFERIAQAEFGHGRTRQRGAELASGEVIVFLTQDATPIGTDWLSALVAPLADPTVAGAFAKQIPRSGCVPVIKYEIERVFANPPAGFYSDTCSATKRALLLGPLPLRDVNFSEDFAFATDALAAGMQIVYAEDAEVLHSNDIELGEYAARMRAEIRGTRMAGHQVKRYSWLGAMLRAIATGLADQPRILRDPEYAPAAKLKWLVVNPLFHFARWHGIYSGARDRI